MLKIGRHIVSHNKPTIMGILNVTPDSFSDGGCYFNLEDAVKHALKMEEDGADIIDVGGESSRPGSDPVSVKEEIKRVLPVIEQIRKRSEIPISIDTTKTGVARTAIEAGANMVNDISAGRFDDEILPLVAKKDLPICLMHMKGNPKTMQDNPQYTDVTTEIKDFLAGAISKAEDIGVKSDKIIVDPGIGFGKSYKDNITILKNLAKLKELNRPILIGTSKKSFIEKVLGLPVDERLEATLATISFAYRNGASIFRVHDVKGTKRYLSMWEQLL